MEFKTVILIFCLCIVTALTCVLTSCGDLAEIIEPYSQNSQTEPRSETELRSPKLDELIISSYAYEQLSLHEQTLYIRMKNALIDFEPYIEDNLEDYTFEQLNKVNSYIFLDCPEIFWATEGGTTYSLKQNGIDTVTKYEFSYILSKSQKENMQNKINTVANQFLNNINPDLNEYERTLAVYEYILNNTDYDMKIRDKIANGKNDSETNASQTIASVFIDKKTVCAGYSKATQYLLNKLGIFCIYVSGSAKGEGNNHAWNLVRIEGEYYLLDTTWGTPIDIATQERRISYDYFCLTTDEFNKTHTPNGDIELPDCTATKYNYYIYNNLMLREYDSVLIEEIMKNAVSEKEESINIKFSNKAAYENATTNLFDNDEDIFNILSNIASTNSNNSKLDDTSIYYSFNPEVNVIYIEFVYK